MVQKKRGLAIIQYLIKSYVRIIRIPLFFTILFISWRKGEEIDFLFHFHSNRFKNERTNECPLPVSPLKYLSMVFFIEIVFFAYFDDPQYRRHSSGITKYRTIGIHSIFQKEDFIEYRGIKELKPKSQIQVDRFFFIPEEVHILPKSSSLMVRNNSLVGIGTPITFNIRSRVGGLVRLDKKKI